MAQDVSEHNYLSIVAHYEDCLARHGDTHLGVDWPNREDALKRYRVMLEVVRPTVPAQKITLLDFGCGASHLYEYMRACGLTQIEYAGLDLSEKFVRLAQSKFPANSYYCLDMLATEVQLPQFDYVVMNGVFTEKRALTFAEMLAYFKRLVTRVFAHARMGLAFNVMSKQVDWERDDLFHLPLDTLADFLTKELSRNFVIRNDYGLYEYTTYIYK
jgi:cyclopropane fatty-acyl-phospholipid synthase-like methyltransferase